MTGFLHCVTFFIGRVGCTNPSLSGWLVFQLKAVLRDLYLTSFGSFLSKRVSSGGLGCSSKPRGVSGLIFGEVVHNPEFSNIFQNVCSEFKIRGQGGQKPPFGVFSCTLGGSRSKFRVEIEICYGNHRLKTFPEGFDSEYSKCDSRGLAKS